MSSELGRAGIFVPLGRCSDWSGFLSSPDSGARLPAPLSCLVFGGETPPTLGGYTGRPEWSRFTVWEIRGAADKGITLPSGAVHAGGVTSVAGVAARRP